MIYIFYKLIGCGSSLKESKKATKIQNGKYSWKENRIEIEELECEIPIDIE